VHNPSGQIPNDPELPLLLDKVYPCHEVVKIDYHLPGCPPSADTIWEALRGAADRPAGRAAVRADQVRLTEEADTDMATTSGMKRSSSSR
jgi:coenzyme F420-reducing hydrogenase gamma subunit